MLYFFDNKRLNNKILYKQLYAILGINMKTASLVSAKFGLGIRCKINFLYHKVASKLIASIPKKYLIGNTLLEKNYTHYKSLIVLKTYRGFRHKNLLPSRGQRTHTNAKTRRKKHS